MRQPFLLIALVFIAGFGAYRAFRYAAGYRRLLGAILTILIALAASSFRCSSA